MKFQYMDDSVSVGAITTATFITSIVFVEKILDALYEGQNIFTFVLSIYIQFTTERSRLYTVY